MMNKYQGVRRREDDGGTRISYEARIHVDEKWRCLGFFDSVEEAARCVNRECGKRGLPMPNEVDPEFRRVRCGDGTITTMMTCVCGSALRIGKSGQVQHCSRTYVEPFYAADILPIDTSAAHNRALKKIRRRIERSKVAQRLRERIHEMLITDQEVVYERGKPVIHGNA